MNIIHLKPRNTTATPALKAMPTQAHDATVLQDKQTELLMHLLTELMQTRERLNKGVSR